MTKLADKILRRQFVLKPGDYFINKSPRSNLSYLITKIRSVNNEHTVCDFLVISRGCVLSTSCNCAVSFYVTNWQLIR